MKMISKLLCRLMWLYWKSPEHLNWYHHGRRWTDKFKHVVGVIHTNYLDYAMREEDGEAKAKALAIMNQLVCRMHCHKVTHIDRLHIFNHHYILLSNVQNAAQDQICTSSTQSEKGKAPPHPSMRLFRACQI